VKVWVRDAAVLLVRLVDREVGNHAPADKLLGYKLPYKRDVFFHRKLVLQGNIEAVRELGFFAALGLLHGVPKSLAVGVFGRGVRRQDNVRTDHAALVCVVADLAVVFAIEILTGAVGRGRDHRLSRAPFDLGDVEMKQGQLFALLLASRAFHQGGNIRQGKDLLYQQTELGLAHAVHLRGHALHIGPAGDKAVITLFSFALLIILNAVFQPLLLMPVLLHLGGGLVQIFL